jgi:hypothetical protein
MIQVPNERLSRRRLLAVLASSSPLVVAQRKRALVAARRIDRATLLAVADAVLPSSLGASGLSAVVAAFERWLAGYRGGAELLHGYGTSELAHAPPSPAPRFATDLAELDRRSRERHGVPFGQLSADERRALVEQAVDSRTEGSLPSPARAHHVAIGLLAHWASSPAGIDAGYGVRINRFACRPLSASPDSPAMRRSG